MDTITYPAAASVLIPLVYMWGFRCMDKIVENER